MAPNPAQLAQLGNRIQSFDKKQRMASLQWPFTSPDSTLTSAELAFAGFHHCPIKAAPLRTRCFLCTGEVSNWEEGDDPVDVHFQQSPSCGWAVIKTEEWLSGVRPKSDWLQSWGEAQQGHPRGDKMHHARLDTFRLGWPYDGAEGMPTTEQIAEAGFHFEPEPEEEGGLDRCVCAFCKREASQWEKGDDPV